ncbi:MAG: acyl-CoA dehydratase activase [Desulfitobacteriaceae bacterium]|nr:acyl-CoA dehydratase activase [Desulfitobacteriaceae bacterium]MDI6915490.1 acyl-CoA dehydratase activase [Desulfitobacteriaceae bacterium]
MEDFFVGVDIGSLTAKVVLVDAQGQALAWAVDRSGYSGRDVAQRLTQEILEEKGIKVEQIKVTVATGYGRVTYPAEREVSEITCQAKGIAHFFPGARTVIDIGGQDSKVIKVLPGGKVIDFAMNDKCAAGTGRFLEVMAGALEVSLEEVGALAVKAEEHKAISSFCTVFAESEVISHVSAGALKPDILAGVCDSVAARVSALVERVGLEPDVVFTGGVAKNAGVAKALSEQIGYPLLIPENPQITAALGAALLAWGMG